MAQKMFLVANATDVPLIFENAANSGDNLSIPPYTMVHTGGVHGNLCNIPGCVDPKDFSGRHISVRSTGTEQFALYFWSGETGGKPLFTSDKPAFVAPPKTQVPGSDTWIGAVLMIYRRDEKLLFGFYRFDTTEELH
jgi:hypothetical protein